MRKWLGILCAIVSIECSYGHSSRTVGELWELRNAVESFEAEYFRYPSNDEDLRALLSGDGHKGNPRRLCFYQGDLLDRWGNPYQYRYPGKHSGLPFDVFSLGPDGKSTSDGDDKDDVTIWRPHRSKGLFGELLVFVGILAAVGFAAVAALRFRKAMRA